MWKPFLPAAEANALGAQALAHLVRRGFFLQLAALIESACAEPAGGAAGPAGAQPAGAGAAAARPAVPAAEALSTALVVRYLALQGA